MIARKDVRPFLEIWYHPTPKESFPGRIESPPYLDENRMWVVKVGYLDGVFKKTVAQMSQLGRRWL